MVRLLMVLCVAVAGVIASRHIDAANLAVGHGAEVVCQHSARAFVPGITPETPRRWVLFVSPDCVNCRIGVRAVRLAVRQAAREGGWPPVRRLETIDMTTLGSGGHALTEGISLLPVLVEFAGGIEVRRLVAPENAREVSAWARAPLNLTAEVAPEPHVCVSQEDHS